MGNEKNTDMDTTLLNATWVLGCAVLVFSMQAGFLCLESGLTRSNRVVDKVRQESDRASTLARSADNARLQAETTNRELKQQVVELSGLNDFAEASGLQMVDLKMEMNQLLDTVGRPEKYSIKFATEFSVENAESIAATGSHYVADSGVVQR